jgi:multiple sugar transport system permease protein/raffinose/stachyose/melibiose transport system permease protein
MARAGRLLNSLLALPVGLYTLVTVGPFFWIAILSLRITPDIFANPYGSPVPPHWEKFAAAWFHSNYDVYFGNSLLVVGCAVALVTVIGAMAAHCLARYRFTGNRFCYFLIFSTLIFPPQLVIIALYQILIGYGLFDTRIGLVLVYVSLNLPITVYILESFFRRIPGDLYDAARIDGYSEMLVFWKISFPIAWPAISATIILNTITLWNEFLFAVVLISTDSRRTLPIGILKFMGDQGNDVGMVATGLMISIVPIVIIYLFFSEKLIQGITAGAVK